MFFLQHQDIWRFVIPLFPPLEKGDYAELRKELENKLIKKGKNISET